MRCFCLNSILMDFDIIICIMTHILFQGNFDHLDVIVEWRTIVVVKKVLMKSVVIPNEGAIFL